MNTRGFSKLLSANKYQKGCFCEEVGNLFAYFFITFLKKLET